MSSIPFFLITGFLGSGKTTLLKRILNTHADSKKIAVIQNEFAPANVDGKELRETGKPFEIMEINRGSVFCVCLLSDFISSLSRFIDAHNPDIVVLEATGLADPIAVVQLLGAETLRHKLYLAHVWCIVDAPHFLRMEQTVTRVAHQVRVADTVVINKIDKAADDKQAVISRVKELNPFAQIIATSYCAFDFETQVNTPVEQPVAIRRNYENAQLESGGRPDIESAVIKTSSAISRKNLERFLSNHAEETYRLKGYVRLDKASSIMVQSCFGKTEVMPAGNDSAPTEIIMMGPGLDGRMLQQQFDMLCAGAE